MLGVLILGGVMLSSVEQPTISKNICEDQPTFGLPYVFESIPQAEFYIEQRAITLEGCN